MLEQAIQVCGMDLEESNNAVVIGNGESRRSINLEIYKSKYTMIGCNALHRDISVDHLICCDRRMAEEATNNINNQNTKIYVRPSWFHYFRKIKKNKNVNLLPDLPYTGEVKRDQPDHWGSGCYAILLAATLGYKEIEIIGFDLYPIDHTVNNIYKNTANYSKQGSQPVDPSYWIYQISQVFTYFPNSNFIIKNHQAWQLPNEWQKFNVQFIAI